MSFVISLYFLYIILSFNDKVLDLSDTKVHKTLIPDNDLPPHYPNGWIPVIESKNILINQIKNFIVFGQHLVAFRGPSGQAYVLDAFCPHLGANIGVGGKIVGEFGEDCIRCPFHGWTFRGRDGLCVKINETKTPEIPTARIKVWDSIEINNNVFVWYHSKGLAPNWYPQRIPQIETKMWVFEGRTEHMEIPENGPDRAHLHELHSPSIIGGNFISKHIFHELMSRVLYHEWESEWWPSEAPDQHMANMTLKSTNKLFGYSLPEINFNIRQIGPAFVELFYSTSALGGISGAFIQMVTPIEPNLNRIVHHIYTEPTLKAKLFAKFMLFGEIKMLERDIIIWNNKKFLKNPVFSKNERSLVVFRRWFKQFYSEEDLNQW